MAETHKMSKMKFNTISIYFFLVMLIAAAAINAPSYVWLAVDLALGAEILFQVRKMEREHDQRERNS